MARLALAADDLAGPLELFRHALVGSHDFIESVGDFAGDAFVIARHADREIAGAHRLQGKKERAQFGRMLAVGVRFFFACDGGCNDRRRYFFRSWSRSSAFHDLSLSTV